MKKLFAASNSHALQTCFRNALLAGLAAVVLSACGPDGQDRDGSVRLTPVKTVAVERGTLATYIQASGTIWPNFESYIGPRVSGRIETFFVDEGQYVEAGTPLVQLEQVRFQLTLQEARAAFEESRTDLENLEHKLQRKQKLFKTGVVDKQLLDDLVTEVALARARADAARSRFERAQVDLQDSTLYAPVAGFVVERRMNAGEMYSAMSKEYVFHLVETATVKVEVNIFETKKRYVSVGQQVPVSVDARPDKTWQGDITVVNPLIEQASRKFLVKITVPNEGFELEAGMFARVRIPEETRADVLLVPARAVVERDGRSLVFVVEDGRAVEREIGIGLMTYAQVEVTGGLKEGEAVIVEGLYAVKDGTAVRVE